MGEPWIGYSHRGETVRIDAICAKEAGYLTWPCTAASRLNFKVADLKFGRELFKEPWVLAPEFAQVRNQEDAFRVARQWLTQAIDYAHQRKIKIWLGQGDCPTVPPNLAKHSRLATGDFFGDSVSAAGRFRGSGDLGSDASQHDRDLPQGRWLLDLAGRMRLPRHRRPGDPKGAAAV